MGGRQRQQRQHEQGSQDQLHAQTVGLVVDVLAGGSAHGAATLSYRPSTLGAD